MATATGSLRRIIYGTEATFGAGLGASASILRNVSDSLNLARTTSESAELRGDRSKRFLRLGNESVTGDISFELAHGDFDDILAAVMCNSWVAGTGTKTLVQGDTITSFAFEKGFTDISRYIEYVGCVANSLAISFSTDSIVSGTLGIIGAGNDGGYTSVSGFAGTPTEPTNTEPFVSFDGELLIDGADGCGIITALDFTIDNGYTANYTLCTPEAVSMTPASFNVTGTITALFQDSVELDKFLAEETSTLKVTLTDVDANTLEFEFPKIKYTGGDVPVSGDGVISLSLPFTALYDETVKSSIRITTSDASAGL
jgi:hypothetical protein